MFATASDNYTHEAFEVYAFDYLVKPFKPDRIKNTIERIKNLKSERDSNLVLKCPAVPVRQQNLRLMFQSNDKCVFVNMYDIIMVTRNGRKTVIFTLQGIIKTYEPLRKLEKRLINEIFFRCHKGFIVNRDMIVELAPWGNKTYLVKLANTKETALMTIDKAREFRQQYCIE